MESLKKKNAQLIQKESRIKKGDGEGQKADWTN